MILSSAAQMLNTGSSGIASLASANFRTGVYTVGGVTVTAADIVDHPEWIGVNGLELLEDGDVANATGGLLDAILLANGRFVLEWDHGTASGLVQPMIVSDGASSGLADNVIRIRRLSGSHYLFVEDYAGGGYRGVADSFAFGDGVHRIDLTRTHDTLAFSADGRSEATGDIDDFVLTPTTATFGGFAGDTLSDTIYIRSLTVFSP